MGEMPGKPRVINQICICSHGFSFIAVLLSAKRFPVLLARLPESVKSDHYVQKILKKLEKYGKIPDLKIHPDTFLKALADLQVWELCSPEIAAAVEVR